MAINHGTNLQYEIRVNDRNIDQNTTKQYTTCVLWLNKQISVVTVSHWPKSMIWFCGKNRGFSLVLFGFPISIKNSAYVQWWLTPAGSPLTAIHLLDANSMGGWAMRSWESGRHRLMAFDDFKPGHDSVPA